MFVSPISVNAAAQAKQSKSKPTFKRQNYINVFEKQYQTKLRDWTATTQMYEHLLDAALKFKGAYISPLFRQFEKKSLLWPLMYLTKYTLRTPSKDFEKVIKNMGDEPCHLAMTDDGRPLVSIINNGRYEEENFISRLQNGEQRNFNIIFTDAAEGSDRLIIFGQDYNSFDVYAARGTVDIPAKNMETFYSITSGGRLKQRISYSPVENTYNLEKFSKEGKRLPNTSSFLDEFGRTITGW